MKGHTVFICYNLLLKHFKGPCLNKIDSGLVPLNSSSSNYLANNGSEKKSLKEEKQQVVLQPATHMPSALKISVLLLSLSLSQLQVLVLHRPYHLYHCCCSFPGFWMKQCSGEIKIYSYVHLIYLEAS